MKSRESIYKNYEPAVFNSSSDTEKAYWFIFSGDKMIFEKDDKNYLIPYIASPEDIAVLITRKQYLGTLYGKPAYSAEASSIENIPDNVILSDLKSAYRYICEDLFLLAGKALQIVNWDKAHQFCGKCGSPTVYMENERAKVCPKCGFRSYPRLSPAVITAIIKDGQILLAHAKHFSGDMHSVIAGFVEPGETLEEAVQREIKEEVGLKVKNIKYFGNQPWPFPDSLMIGFTAEYLEGEICADGYEIDHADWYTPNNLPPIPSEISIARKLIDWYIENY